MDEPTLPKLAQSGFSLVPELSESALLLQFAGSAELAAAEPIRNYLSAAHEVAIRRGLAEVRVDLRALKFMNSSCFKSFVTWLDTVANHETGYRVRFLANAELHWQRRSLESLRRLAAHVVSVEF
ncbi:MAG TPA: hypothetical protein VFQ61_02715 [Polyangiaceae bacterium]|nr:hypothetical protein [Polyangiaceae bacterium]